MQLSFVDDDVGGEARQEVEGLDQPGIHLWCWRALKTDPLPGDTYLRPLLIALRVGVAFRGVCSYPSGTSGSDAVVHRRKDQQRESG